MTLKHSPKVFGCRLSRVIAAAAGLILCAQALAQTDPLPSWNDGSTKQAIEFCENDD